MEEEVNENELEEQFYSMLHYVDDTQVNVNTSQDALAFVESAPRSTIKRYWRTNDDNGPYQRENTMYHKDNTNNHKGNSYQRESFTNHKVNIPQRVNTLKETSNITNNDKTKPKEENHGVQEPLPVHLSFFRSPMPQNMKNTIEIIEHDVTGNVVDLDTSDEDEVIEVALPPKPTITIESSDDEELQKSPLKRNIKPSSKDKSAKKNREMSTSPVPSVVSSVSDEFIRSDCIALNISSKCSDDHSFDFSLHGADLLGQSTPSKKKKKKKNKEATSTPVDVTPSNPKNNVTEECFATPKSKAKKKRQKNKSYSVTEKSIPNADVYDSDSNQSMVLNPFAVSNVSLPTVGVNESDSSPHVANKPKQVKQNNNFNQEKQQEDDTKNSKSNSISQTEAIAIVDLTDNPLSDENTDIQENIVMGNVTGFPESDDYGDPAPQTDVTKYCSTRVPAILYENLDFDNLKGKDKVCKNRRYSLTTLRAEMEKFYNESWGGEEFNHHEIQRNMSRDKHLWAIDPKDRMPPTMNRKNKPICNYCNRYGHRDETCYKKPSVCYMCGSTGHVEPRCPSKICVNCGSPNYMYSTMCRNCSTWGRLRCAECGQIGHPSSHCPDIWRRYHNTIQFTNRLEENRSTKKYAEMFCSGCTRRGHLAHTCRFSLPFTSLPINSPYVQLYAPVYMENQQHLQNMFNNQRIMGAPFPQDSTISSPTQFRGDRNKRQSKSPTVHDGHANKKRTMDAGDAKSPVNTAPRKLSVSKDPSEEEAKATQETEKTTNDVAPETQSPDKAPDFIPIGVNNRDKKGQMIQDNEVSDTSDAVTSARIYVTDEIIEKLKTKEGEEWLKETTTTHNVIVENTDIQTFLSIKGKFVDQEAFQAALRDWTKGKPNKDIAKSDNEGDVTVESENDQSSNNIPRKRQNVLRKINKALESLNKDLGEPKTLYDQLTASQNRHEQLLKLKVINPKQLKDSRNKINELLKKLNMVLLGQAGLAGGRQHLNGLYSLQNKLTNFRQKNITDDMRKEIGEHFHIIFTAIPRNDYRELLRTYYNSKKMTNARKRLMKVRLTRQQEKYSKNFVANKQNKRPNKKLIASSPAQTSLAEACNKVHTDLKSLQRYQSNESTHKKKTGLKKTAKSILAELRIAQVTEKTLEKIRQFQKETHQLLYNNIA